MLSTCYLHRSSRGVPGGTPHAVRGVPGHPIVTNPAQSSSEQFTWPTSVVCDSAVDGNIEIPSGGTPQDVLIFNMAATLEKANTSGFCREARTYSTEASVPQYGFCGIN